MSARRKPAVYSLAYDVIKTDSMAEIPLIRTDVNYGTYYMGHKI